MGASSQKGRCACGGADKEGLYLICALHCFFHSFRFAQGISKYLRGVKSLSMLLCSNHQSQCQSQPQPQYVFLKLQLFYSSCCLASELTLWPSSVVRTYIRISSPSPSLTDHAEKFPPVPLVKGRVFGDQVKSGGCRPRPYPCIHGPTGGLQGPANGGPPPRKGRRHWAPNPSGGESHFQSRPIPPIIRSPSRARYHWGTAPWPSRLCSMLL